MSNIVLIKALAIACRDALQVKHELADNKVAAIAASAVESAILALDRVKLARGASVALANDAGTYQVGECRIGSNRWRQITNRPRTLAEATQMAMMAPDGRQRIVSDPVQVSRLIERGEWGLPQ